MTLAYGWDAAPVPNPVPTTINGQKQSYAGFYIGGSSAFHVWTPDELLRLDEAGETAGLLAMPIWVPTPGFENPRQVGLEAAARLRALGIPANAKPWRVMMWDMETGNVAAYPSWMTIAANTLASTGYGSLVYGSVDGSGLFSMPARTGYMVAFPNGRPQLYPHPNVVGTQYQFSVPVPGGEVDLDVVESSLLAHLGRLS